MRVFAVSGYASQRHEWWIGGFSGLQSKSPSNLLNMGTGPRTVGEIRNEPLFVGFRYEGGVSHFNSAVMTVYVRPFGLSEGIYKANPND